MPIYDLEAVQKAARKGFIRYRGRKVNRDIANLGYSLNEVTECICQLKTENFNKTISYDSDQASDDVYHMTYIFNPENNETKTDRLYLKFRFTDGVINIGSFHL